MSFFAGQAQQQLVDVFENLAIIGGLLKVVADGLARSPSITASPSRPSGRLQRPPLASGLSPMRLSERPAAETG
jgi:hypothetical protein